MKFISCVLLFFSFSIGLFSQDKSNIEHTIQSEVFGKERTVSVFLPERYFADSTSTFIVTYVLDAQYAPFWNMFKNNMGYLVESYGVIPMIAVGIHSDNRGREFTPPATQLQDHIEKEVFPLIEEQYRIKSFKTIVGHSWGGAFIASTLFGGKMDLFDAYVSISPSMGYQDNSLLHQADSVLSTGQVFGKFWYCSSGDVGSREANFGGQVAYIDSLIGVYQNPTLAWKTAKFEGKDHWTCVIPSVNDGLIRMCQNYWADQDVMEDFAKHSSKNLRTQVEEYIARQDSIFGFSEPPSAGYIRFVGNDFLELKNYKVAIELYDWALSLKPDDLRIYKKKAETYKGLGKQKLALKNYEQALTLLEAQKEKFGEEHFNNEKEWLQKKIAELKD